MIVWLASYPRSGNTFFRILLHQLYGFPTYSGFLSGDDLSFVGAGEITGHETIPLELRRALVRGDRAALAPFQDSDDLFFIKSHLSAGETALSELPTVLLVRDVRDVLVSFAWYLIQIQTRHTRAERLSTLLRHPVRHSELLRARVTARLRDLGLERWLFRAHLWFLARDPRWSRLNNEWLDRPQGGPPWLLRYEDLVARPVEAVREALEGIGVRAKPTADRFPDFDELKRVYPQFFREGKIGAGRQRFSDRLHEKLWQVHGPTMRRLGYPPDPV